ncbi:unnamed protein product [Phaedon cochleariae]|uniref:Uncharacterized protein n=1 Tax=Phaedon cochleariae TaxID=80249 RepID=A0A9N9X5P4_PHACE|nr:unnamed protein product [Phaedon cochleariae]
MMDINCICPAYKCNIMEFLPYFLDVDEYHEDIKIAPSRLLHELQMSTEERLERLCRPTRRKKSATQTNSFSAIPDIVIFQNFQAGHIYKAKLTLQNLQPVRYKMCYPNLSEYRRYLRKLSAYNCSQFTVEFKWKTCKSNAMEELEKSKLVNAMSDLAGLEKKKNVKLEYMNIIDAEGHSAIIDQELARQIKDMENQFLFGNTIFSVLPVEGKMLPNQCLEFTIIFSPQKSDYYTDFAYFDVTGREDRIVLCLSGGGRGPQVVFNAKTLNANDIFLDGTHEYQIVAKNDGNIPAVVSFVEKDTEFGGVIKCMPKRQYLYSRDICKSFVISFCSKFQGQFVEKIQFMIDESKELIDVLFVGNVICPLLKPDIQDIDFGEVSFGSQPSKELVLTNDSQVPIDFRLYIPGNKQQNGKEEFDEFEFSPREGVVEAFSSSVIKVTLTTQALRDIDETLMVSMWGSQRYSIQLPLRYNCVCPTIKCTPEEVFISFCFLNYEYKRTIILKNCSSVSGVLTYTPLETEFFVFPNEEIEIELTIQTDKLGTHEFPLIFTMAGSSPESICTVICNGQGPVVSYEPDELQFESIILLHEVSKMLTLINDSPIIANITVSTSPTSPFASDVAHLEIAPEDRRELTVRGYLTDTGRYKESLNIEIENGEIVAIPILGEGVGSSILCEPIIDPEYDAGILLTHQIFKLKVKFTNLGKKRYKISWTRRQGLKNLKELDDEDVYASVFRIEPVRFELGRNESQQIEIIGSSKKPQGVQEDFYCFALIDKSTKLTNIMSCLMKAEFVEPNVQFSDWTLNFLCATEDYPTFFRKPQPSSLTPMVDYEEFYRPPVDTTGLVITNDTELPLKLVMKTTSDYYINNDGEMMTEMGYELNAGDNYNAQIEFRPKSQSKRYSKKNGRFTVDFSQHPKEDNITLIGEVMYPTINLVPDKYHFECLPLDSYTCTTILIQNVTFMPLEYSWELLEDGFEIENLEVLADYDNTCIRSSMKSIESDDINKLEEITSVAAASQPKFNMSHIKKSASKVHSSHLHNKKVVSMANIPSKLIAKNRGLTEHSQKDLTKRESSVASEKLLKTVLLDDEQTGSAEEIHIDWDYKTYDMEATKFIKNIAINHLVQEDTEFFCDIENEASSAYSIGNIVTIEPSNGVLAPFEYGAVTIGFFPPPNVKVKCTAICKVEGGEDEPFLITGMSSRISYKFDKQVIEFGRRIGYLEPYEVQVHGYASFPQLSLTLPREIVANNWNDLSYRAISSITEEYLLSFSDVKNENITKYVHKRGCPENMNEAAYKSLLRDDWVIISDNDVYPTETEIDLSRERTLLNEYLRSKSFISTQSVTRKVDTISEFIVSPYLLDFGYVIMNKPVCYTVLILNCGPVDTEVRLEEINRSRLDNNELKIEFRTKRMGVGDMTELYVIFSPTRKRCGPHERCIEECIFLTVKNGGKIPILIRATATIPTMNIGYSCIEFGTVKIGSALRKSIIIQNDGNLLSKWTTEVRSLNNQIDNAYHIIPNKGELLPGKKDLLNIYWVPTKKGANDSELTIRIERNNVNTSVELYGHAIEPTLAFSELKLDFDASLPYSEKIENIDRLISEELVKNEVGPAAEINSIIQSALQGYNMDNEKQPEEDIDDVGTPKTGKGSTKKIKQEPSKNFLKQITKDLQKDLKSQFESFRNLLEEILHICEFWERHCQVLIRPFSKGNLTSKKDTKSSAKESAPESKSSNKKGRKIVSSSTGNFSKVNFDALGQLERIEESTTTFSVVRQMKYYKKNLNKYFKICQPTIEKIENTVHLATSSAGGSLRKKSSKRKASAERKENMSSTTTNSGLRVTSNLDAFSTRYVLSPSDKTKYEITFSPAASGKYTYNYLIELVGIDRPYTIQCTASCQLPEISWNPEIVFPKYQDAYQNKILGENFVYYNEEDVFDFGYIFIGTHKTLPYATKIMLQNASALPCEITAQLAENSLFVIEKEKLSIKPQESEEFPMSLKAAKKGRIQSELFITIKYNPKVKVIRLAAQACPVEFNVQPKALSFEKVPLHYSDKRKITLTNSSPVNLVWKFVKAEWTLDIYNISKMSGAIKLYSVDEIIIEYFPTNEETNPKKSFEIQVFDLNHSDIIPIYKEDISVVSESVVYQVEYKSHIDLGDVRGRSQMKIPFHMSNNGKCNVSVVFELCPASDLYFGYQQVGTAKSQKMEIKNTGRFSFEYAILSFDETVMGQMKKHKADEQKVKSSMDVKPTTKASTLEVEGFSIDSSTGVVLPNEKVQINVEYIPKEMKEYDRILVIFVTECQKEDLYGRKFILHGEGTQPSCNFDDYEKMFREHFIVRELGDFTSPENVIYIKFKF